MANAATEQKSISWTPSIRSKGEVGLELVEDGEVIGVHARLEGRLQARNHGYNIPTLTDAVLTMSLSQAIRVTL